MYDLPPILKKLRLQHPNIDLHVTNMPTRESVEEVIQKGSIVTLPIASKYLRITPLRAQKVAAIFAPSAREVPDEVTPGYVARQSLIIEQTRGAVYALLMRSFSTPAAVTPAHATGHGRGAQGCREIQLGHVDRAGCRRGPRQGLYRASLAPLVPATLALILHPTNPMIWRSPPSATPSSTCGRMR
jgi:hypothetical protein